MFIPLHPMMQWTVNVVDRMVVGMGFVVGGDGGGGVIVVVWGHDAHFNSDDAGSPDPDFRRLVIVRSDDKRVCDRWWRGGWMVVRSPTSQVQRDSMLML